MNNLIIYKDKEMKHNFKVGDKVKVVRRIDRQEGWNNTWIDSMDSAIDKEFTIINIREKLGIEISIKFGLFPSDSLELIKDSLEIKELQTEADIIQALLDGETLIDIKENKYFLNKKELMFYFKNHNEQKSERLEMSAKDILLYKPKIYKEAVEIPWYENIPEQGKLCWVSHKDSRNKQTQIIHDYRDTHITKFFSNYTAEWYYEATPLTNEEIKQFLQDE